MSMGTDMDTGTCMGIGLIYTIYTPKCTRFYNKTENKIFLAS